MKPSKFIPFAISLGLVMPVANAEGLSASLTLVSNYKTRGQDQTQNKPAVQGGFEYQWGNGFFLGNWNSSISWDPRVSIETDVYGGYNGTLGGFDYEVGFFRYSYPGYSLANTLELNATIGFSGLQLYYAHSVSRRYFTYETKANYLNLSYTHPVSDSISLIASLGRTNYLDNAAAGDLPDFTDFRIGAEVDLGNGYTLSAGRVGANRTDLHGVINKPRFIVGLTKSM